MCLAKLLVAGKPSYYQSLFKYWNLTRQDYVSYSHWVFCSNNLRLPMAWVRTFQLTDNKKQNLKITWQANKISIRHIILVVINFDLCKIL